MEKYSKLRLIYPFLVHVGDYKGDADFILIEVSPLTLCKLETYYWVFFHLYSSSLVLDAANGMVSLLAIESSLRLRLSPLNLSLIPAFFKLNRGWEGRS